MLAAGGERGTPVSRPAIQWSDTAGNTPPRRRLLAFVGVFTKVIVLLAGYWSETGQLLIEYWAVRVEGGVPVAVRPPKAMSEALPAAPAAATLAPQRGVGPAAPAAADRAVQLRVAGSSRSTSPSLPAVIRSNGQKNCNGQNIDPW
jgi:hypothetical protein